MKAVITPFAQKELGFASFKADQDVTRLISSARKFIIEPVPRELAEHMEDGLIVVEQSMATNAELEAFFNSDELFQRIGGIDSLVAFLRKNKHVCQASDPSMCDNHLVHAERDGSAAMLCWHHDNHYRMRGFSELKDVLYRNRVDWILDTALHEMGLPDSRDLSIQELCWWAFMRNMIHLMPEEICRIAINKTKSTEEKFGPTKEADILPYDDRAIAYVRMMEEKGSALRAKVCPIEADPEPGMAYFKRPKIKPLKLPNYLAFVASRPCSGCGSNNGVSPYMVHHHRLCAHDFYTIPLCRACQEAVSRDKEAWEQAHGKLVSHQRLFFDYAVGVGAITSHSSNNN